MLLGALVVWEITWRVFKIPLFVVSLPSGILAETWAWRGYLLTHSWVTLYETLAGFALSIAVGTPLAVMLVYSPVLRSALYPLLVVTQAIPKVAIAPVLLLLLGAGEVSKVVIAFLVMAVGLFALVELVERLVCPWYALAREQGEVWRS